MLKKNLILIVLVFINVRYCISEQLVKYDFNVKYLNGIATINGLSPGPEIRIKKGELLRVTVKNSFDSEPLSMYEMNLKLKN